MGQGTIPDDWGGEYCCYTVQWPNSPQWLAVLRGVLILPSSGRFWDEHTGVITEAQTVIRETYDTNLHLEEALMSCNDTTSVALTAIANSIAMLANTGGNGGCCGSPQTQVNNTIQGTANPPVGGTPVPIYGSSPPIALEPNEIPEGYDTLEEYNEDKCRKANSLVNATIAANKAMGAITAFNLTGLTALTVMAIGGVLVVAPELIPILVAGIILLAANVSYLDAAGDYMNDHKEEWVCALYNEDSVEGMVEAISDLLDILVSAISATGVIGFTIKTAILVLLNADNLNKLLTNAPMLGVTEIDCSNCQCSRLLFDFTDSDNGYDYSTGSCDSSAISTAGSSVSWSAAGLRMQAPNVASTNWTNAFGPSDFDIEIVEGLLIVVEGHRVSETGNYIRIDITTTENGCRPFNAGSFESTTNSFILTSLDTIVGEHLTNINIVAGNSVNQLVDVEVVLIEVTCESPV